MAKMANFGHFVSFLQVLTKQRILTLEIGWFLLKNHEKSLKIVIF